MGLQGGIILLFFLKHISSQERESGGSYLSSFNRYILFFLVFFLLFTCYRNEKQRML